MTDYEYYKLIGICPRCRKEKAKPNGVICWHCAEKAIYANAVAKERLKADHAELRKHYDYENYQRRNRRAQRAEHGLCNMCGKLKARTGYKTCGLCAERHRVRQMLYRASQQSGAAL